MAFTQTMIVRASSPDTLGALLDGWHRDQAGVAPGYQGARVLADRSEPGRFVIEVDFSSEEEARRNSDRPETQAWAGKLREAAEGEPDYHDYDVAYTTG